MAKQTIKEKEEQRKKQERYERGYKDYWFLLLITFICWILESPAVYGLLADSSRDHFPPYGVAILVVSTVGYLLAVLLLALDKRKGSIIASVTSGLLIVLFCAFIYAGYERAHKSEFNVAQIVVSYAIPAVAVPLANIIMVNRRL